MDKTLAMMTNEQLFPRMALNFGKKAFKWSCRCQLRYHPLNNTHYIFTEHRNCVSTHFQLTQVLFPLVSIRSIRLSARTAPTHVMCEGNVWMQGVVERLFKLQFLS